METIDQLISRRQINPFKKDNIGWTIFHYFARHGLVEQCKKVLGQIREFCQVVELINTPDRYGDSPLSDAAFWGHSDMAGLLIRNGADPNVRNCQGETPALRAVLGGHPATVKLLIPETDLYMKLDTHGNTLLHEVVYQEGPHIPEVVRLIRESGFEEQQNDYGDTAIRQELPGF